MKIADGTFIYRLNEKEITIIIHSDIVGTKDTTVFYKKMTNDTLTSYFSNLNLDTLKSKYDKGNIMFCSGTSLFIKYEKQKKLKEIYLHCYSHNTINDIIQNINKLVPNEYKIEIWEE
jgi:hypothetical protein